MFRRDHVSSSTVDTVVFATCAGCIMFLALMKWNAIVQKRKNYCDVLVSFAKRSNGAFDQHAQEALARLDNLGSNEDMNAEGYFTRAQLRDLNTHEGIVPSNTRANEHRILMDYGRALRSDQRDAWIRDRVQDYLDRRSEQYRDLGIIAPTQYQQLQEELDEGRTAALLREPPVSDKINRIQTQKQWKANDTQNVHDSGVNQSMRKMLRNLMARDNEVVLPLGTFDIRDDISNHIISGDFNEEVKRKALIATQRMLDSNASHTSISHLPESDVLRMVWRRSYHPINSNGETQRNIKDMVVTQLADTITTMPHGDQRVEQVCITGRIGRITDALTHTDNETAVIGQPLSLDAIRNNIYDYAHGELQRQIERFTPAGGTANSDMERVAASYTDPTVTVDDASENAFKANIVSKVEAYMTTEYGDQLSANHQRAIIDTVQAGL